MKTARRLIPLLVVAAAAAAIAAPPAPSTTPDELLRTAEDRIAAALSWLRRQRAAATDQFAEAQKSVTEAQATINDRTITKPRLLLASMAGHDAPVKWTECPAEGAELLPKRLVILVHGLDEPGGIWEDAAPNILAAGFALAQFEYPNDQRITLSADALALSLRSLRSRGVTTIDLVCHSMGGLLARDVLTRAEYYAGNAAGAKNFPKVRSLTVVGTPNRGSAFASLQRISEVREQFVRWVDSGGVDATALSRFLRDGRGEAAADLDPSSAFLKDLNSRPLPRNVHLAAIAGRVGDDGVNHAIDLLDSPIARELLEQSRIDWLKTSAVDLQSQVGDGVVSVESARWEGVDDFVILSANHRTLLRRVTIPGMTSTVVPTLPPAIEEILKRLRQDATP